MYRVQLSGNAYEPDREVGLHYQIHRGIGVHHSSGDPPRAGAPRQRLHRRPPVALTVAAVMPLPEGLPELSFAGALGGRRVRMVRDPSAACRSLAEADFAIVGTIDPDARKPEGPFGDHLGYYSPDPRLPRPQGREGLSPPGRDLAVHLGRPASPGRHLVRRVDPRADRAARGPDRPAGRPRRPRRRRGGRPSAPPGDRQRALRPLRRRYAAPRNCLTSANAILGQGQMSLAKYLLIVAKEDDPGLDIHDIPPSSATSWSGSTGRPTSTSRPGRQSTRSTTRATALNQGSKVVIAAAGPKRRPLPTEVPPASDLPDGFGRPEDRAPRHPDRPGGRLPARRSRPRDPTSLARSFCRARSARPTRSRPSR